MIGNILLLGYLLPMVVSYFIMLYSLYAYKENNYSNEGLTVLSPNSYSKYTNYNRIYNPISS